VLVLSAAPALRPRPPGTGRGLAPGRPGRRPESPAGGAVIIPAYQPDQRLVDLAAVLVEAGLRVVIVDDGSAPRCRPVFDRVRGLGPAVEVLRHDANRGKGAALRTGFRHALRRYPASSGLVTADADGQHSAEAVLAVARRLARRPDRLVLGVRTLGDPAPLRSRVGNGVARGLFRLLHGERLQDTQTGLRGVPRALAEAMLGSPASGYEFELDMLIVARQLAIRYEPVRVEARYFDGNASSHFAPVRDSMRVCLVLVRFPAVSLLTALLDSLVFLAALACDVGAIGLAHLAARLVSGAVNLRLNRRLVGLRQARDPGVSRRYWGVVAASGLLACLALTALHQALAVPLLWARLLVEVLLFPASFVLARDFVFEGAGVAGGAGPRRRRPVSPLGEWMRGTLGRLAVPPALAPLAPGGDGVSILPSPGQSSWLRCCPLLAWEAFGRADGRAPLAPARTPARVGTGPRRRYGAVWIARVLRSGRPERSAWRSA
jgi:putative flippase GtrA